MKKEFKFTSDGKKVVVINKLNSHETIVQEIFIIDGKETPSGEQFVAKSLHDAPAVSWKESEIKRLEQEYNGRKEFYESEIKKYTNLYRDAYAQLNEKLKFLRGCMNKITLKTFDTLTDFLTNKIKFIVEGGYYPKIIEFKDFRCDYDKQKLKLISLFGNDDGSLCYRLHTYSDGSGGSSSEFYPFTNKKDAVIKLSELLNEKAEKDCICDANITEANKYNIKLNKEKILEYKERKKKEYNDEIVRKQKEIEIYGEKIKEINNL